MLIYLGPNERAAQYLIREAELDQEQAFVAAIEHTEVGHQLLLSEATLERITELDESTAAVIQVLKLIEEKSTLVQAFDRMTKQHRDACAIAIGYAAGTFQPVTAGQAADQ